jgi:nitroreductase
MNIYDLILKRRTIRKFKQREIEYRILERLVNAARFAPSASNLQPLKYIIVDNPEDVNKVFKNVKWAAYIASEGTPAEDERPTAFIVILADTEIKKGGYELDIGAAAQNIFLAALEEGIGSCWMGAINRDNIRKILNIPERYIINTVIALGYLGENPVAEDEKGSIKYYKDEYGVLHVPKRRLEDIIIRYNTDCR